MHFSGPHLLINFYFGLCNGCLSKFKLQLNKMCVYLSSVVKYLAAEAILYRFLLVLNLIDLINLIFVGFHFVRDNCIFWFLIINKF